LLRGGYVTFPVAQYFQPLRPLDEPSDVARYLDIDGYKQMYERFTEAFADSARWLSGGHLVVVAGDRGSGKTSLIQRCAHWLKSQSQQHCEIVILDLSPENWPKTGNDNTDTRIMRTFKRIIRKLGSSLPEQSITKLENSSDDLSDFFFELGQVLQDGRAGSSHGAMPVLLIVLLPSYPSAEEVDRYYSLACPGTFFFAEIFDVMETRKMRDVISSSNRGRNDIQHLTMNVLKPGDAREVARWVRRERPGRPVLTDGAVEDWLEPVIKNHKISISELNRLAWGVLREAAEEAADQVESRHFAKYYQEIYLSGISRD